MKLLEGIRILDLTEHNCFGSFMLTEYGAEVIKVERPGGEPMRTYEPMLNGGSIYGNYLNRGRKSISLNMRIPEAGTYIKKLIKDIDIIYENFKGGTMEKYGLSYDELREINPNLIYASLTSYGSTGPMAEYPGFDNISQAMSGLMDITGYAGDIPRVLGYAAGDQISSISGQIAILMGVLSRYKTGKGQRVESSIYESLFHATGVRVILNQLNGLHMTRKGNASLYYAPCDTFKCSDNGYVAIAVTKDEQWRELCKALGLGELIEKYADNNARMDAYESVLRATIQSKISGYTVAEIMAKLESVNVPNGKVKTITEAIQSKITYEREMLAVMPDPIIGPYIMPNRFIKLDNPDREIRPIPFIGQDTKAFLASVGVDDDKYQELIKSNVVKF